MDAATPFTKETLSRGLMADIALTARRLDALRGMAYKTGVAPIFTDEDPLPRARPWDHKETLISDIAQAYARMEAMHGERALAYVSEDARQAAQLAYFDIRYQCSQLHKAGFLSNADLPEVIAKEKYSVKVKNITPYLNTLAMEALPQPQIKNAQASKLAAPDHSIEV